MKLRFNSDLNRPLQFLCEHPAYPMAWAALNEFSVPTYEEWLALVKEQLKGAPFEKKLVRQTVEGIPVQPIYMKKDVETAVAQLGSECRDGRPAAALVEYDELDIIHALEHPGLRLADDPRNLRLGPLVLDCPDDRHGMYRVAQCGEAHDANTLRWVVV